MEHAFYGLDLLTSQGDLAAAESKLEFWHKLFKLKTAPDGVEGYDFMQALCEVSP